MIKSNVMRGACVAVAMLAVACGREVAHETAPEASAHELPPTCEGAGFRMIVGEVLAVTYGSPVTLHVLGGTASITPTPSDRTRVKALTADGTIVHWSNGVKPAIEVVACADGEAEAVWPTGFFYGAAAGQ